MPGITDANGNTLIAIGDTTGTGMYAADGSLRVAVGGGGLFATLDDLTYVPTLSETGTAADNGAALEAAVAAAEAVGGIVKLPAGRFLMDASITTGCTIEFSPGTVLLQGENAGVLDIDLSASAVGPYAITSATMSEDAASSGASSNKFLKLTLTTAGDSANFQVGDAVMICSRDARTYYTGDTNYAGEMFFVADVESGLVYLAGNSYLVGVGTLYTTNFVAYRLARNENVRLIRPQVEVDGDPFTTGVAGSWPGAITIKAAVRPQIENLRINSAWGIGLYFKSCAAPKVTIDHIKDCIGDPTNSRFGYGILLRGACSNAHISGGHIERCRHGITTDCREASSWSAANVWDHGDTTDTTVDGVYAIAHGAPPFDTHENSIHTTFQNCTAHGSRYSPLGITGATGYGFNLRGPWDSVVNCRALQVEGGVNVAATGLIHEVVGDNVIDGFQYWGEALNNLAGMAIVIAGNASETTPQRVTIRNMRPSSGSRGILVEANYTGRIAITHNVFKGFVDTLLRVQGSCTIDVINNLIDMTEGGASELIFSVDNSNTVLWNVIGNAIRSRAASSATVLITTASGATSTIRHAANYEVNAANLSGGISGGAGTNTETAITALA